ncbi:MAG TPA: dihydrofolate reductase [Phnomibacter sp.]|nr:dihydrofolate reductase [Phnomibacter sp.]
MTISIIVAAAENNAIGKNGQLLWHLPNDMKFFKNTTWAMPVIMGRKTWESLGKPLQGRTNIVISRQQEGTYEGAELVPSLPDALALADSLQTHEAFVIGGGQIYKEAIPLAGRIYLTRVHATINDADTFFEGLNWAEWHKVNSLYFEADAKNALAHSIEVWERKVEGKG